MLDILTLRLRVRRRIFRPLKPCSPPPVPGLQEGWSGPSQVGGLLKSRPWSLGTWLHPLLLGLLQFYDFIIDKSVF